MMIRNFTSNLPLNQGKFDACLPVLMDKINPAAHCFFGGKNSRFQLVTGGGCWDLRSTSGHLKANLGFYTNVAQVFFSRKRYQPKPNEFEAYLWRLFGFGIGKYSMFTAPSSHHDDVCIDLSWESKGKPPKATSPKDPFHPRHGTQLFFSPNSNTNSCHKY